jgi:4-hydroxybenzoate polyprenyltransferase
MVRFWKYTKAFLKLIRINNILIIALTMCILRWLVIIPLLGNLYFQSQLSTFSFILLVLATTSIAAAGYVINDYFDRKTDLINKPGRVILGRIFKLRIGMILHFVLSGIGIVLGILLSYKIGNIRLSIIFVAMSGLLWFYSTTYKRQVLLGNVMVALMVACVPLIMLFFELPLILDKYGYYIKTLPTTVGLMIVWIIGYALFAFLLTFIREIIKDLEDYEGDEAFGRNTIPIAWGPEYSKIIVYATLLITLFFIGLAIIKFWWSTIILIYGFLLIVAPILVTVILVYKANTKKSYHTISSLLKIIMLSGLMFNFVARFIIF